MFSPISLVIMSEALFLHAESKDLGERPRRCATRASLCNKKGAPKRALHFELSFRARCGRTHPRTDRGICFFFLFYSDTFPTPNRTPISHLDLPHHQLLSRKTADSTP